MYKHNYQGESVMEYVQNDNVLLMIFLAIAIIIPGIVVLFDDGKGRSK
jgi:hypothetical protein